MNVGTTTTKNPLRNLLEVFEIWLKEYQQTRTKPFKPGRYLYKQKIDYSILYAPSLNYYFPVL